eukprot:UN28178
MDRYQKDVFLIVFIASASITLIDYVLVKIVQRYQERNGIILDGTLHVQGASFLMLSYCWIASIHGSFNVLIMKSVAEIIVESISNENQFVYWQSYVIILAFGYVNFALEYWKQKALGLFGALYVVPIYQVIVIIGGILLGAVYFEELEGLSDSDLLLFMVAVGLTIIGVGLLAYSTGQRADDEMIDMFLEKQGLIDSLPKESTTPDRKSSKKNPLIIKNPRPSRVRSLAPQRKKIEKSKR